MEECSVLIETTKLAEDENKKGGYYRKECFSWQIAEKTIKEEN